MLRVTVPLIAAFFHLTAAETGDAYHGPPQARELFSYNDKLFYFYSDRCSYEEAAAICEAGKMHLATLDEPGKAKFAAESIAEAWMVFEDMWIGARKADLGKWNWTFTGKRIPDEPRMVGNFTYLYPPWVDNQLPAREGKDCLAVDRNGHNDPYFVDLDCKLPRPFICEQNEKQSNTEPHSENSLEIFDIEFILYHGRLSWSAAVSFCRQQGFALATVENMTVARKLAKAMLKSRPEFEDAWIGANYKDDEWNWVENGEEIKTIPAEYKDPNRGDTPDNIITPQFPPWFEPVPRKGRECVIFDRHLCDEPTFIDIKCNRQRDFICVRREQVELKMNDTQIIDRAGKRYIFFPVSATWPEAKKICDEENDRATMLNLTDAEETRFIMQAMSDARNPLNHIWLGGTILNGEWVWIGRDIEVNTTKIPITPDDSGFPPWCDNETNIEMSCLNLDRQNHWTPLIYGLECNSTQAVVCVVPIEPNDRVVKYDGAGQQDPPVSLRISKLVSHPLSWDEADKVCKHDIGKLWRPRFDLEDSVAAINKFFGVVKGEQDPDADVVVYHVNGGKYNAKDKVWIVDERHKVNITTEWEPHDGDCLVGQINKSGSAWLWYPVKCYHKLYSQVICEPYCSLREVPYEEESAEWLCDAAPSEVFDHKMLGMGCTHRCANETVSLGPDRFYCKKKGWFTPQAPIHVNSSICKDKTNGLNVFKDPPKGIATLAFIIDSTSNSDKDYNATKYLIGHLVDYYKTQLAHVVVEVVSIEASDEGPDEGAVLKVNHTEAPDDCAKIKEQILNPLVDKGIGARDYSAGITMVKRALGDTSLGEAHIVFVVPEANQKGSFKEKAQEINQVAKVFAIGTNRHVPINQLVEISSKIDGEDYSIQFKKPPDVIAAVKSLVSSCTGCKCAGAFDDFIASASAEIAKAPEAEKPATETPP